MTTKKQTHVKVVPTPATRRRTAAKTRAINASRSYVEETTLWIAEQLGGPEQINLDDVMVIERVVFWHMTQLQEHEDRRKLLDALQLCDEWLDVDDAPAV